MSRQKAFRLQYMPDTCEWKAGGLTSAKFWESLSGWWGAQNNDYLLKGSNWAEIVPLLYPDHAWSLAGSSLGQHKLGLSVAVDHEWASCQLTVPLEANWFQWHVSMATTKAVWDVTYFDKHLSVANFVQKLW